MNKRKKKLLDAIRRGDANQVRKHAKRFEDVDEIRDESGWTALVLAVHLGHAAVVEALLEVGADPLLRASRRASPWRLAVDRSLPVVKVLAKAVDVNAPLDEFGNTPLMMAARECRADIVEVLLEFGADPHAQTPLGTTALGWAEHEPEDVIPGEENCPSWRQRTIDVLKTALEGSRRGAPG